MSNQILAFPALLALLALCACSPEETKTPTGQPEQPADQQPAPTPKIAAIEKTGDPAIDALADFVATKQINTTAPGWKTQLPMPPQVTFADGKTYFWNLQTNKGALKIELLAEDAPMHVASTIYLTEIGFYDGLKFHRVIKGFMAQGGCPLGNGTGGPGYKYASEFMVQCKNAECGHRYLGETIESIAERNYFVCPNCGKLSAPARLHDKPGLLSMANTGSPGTDGSQFFLTFSPRPNLNGLHTVFGEVVDGFTTLETLEFFGGSGATRNDEAPTTPLWIESATITIE